MVVAVDFERWEQTPDDLRAMAVQADHPRTRERFLALFDIASGSCAASHTTLKFEKCSEPSVTLPPTSSGLPKAINSTPTNGTSASNPATKRMAWPVTLCARVVLMWRAATAGGSPG